MIVDTQGGAEEHERTHTCAALSLDMPLVRGSGTLAPWRPSSAERHGSRALWRKPPSRRARFVVVGQLAPCQFGGTHMACAPRTSRWVAVGAAEGRLGSCRGWTGSGRLVQDVEVRVSLARGR